MRRQIGKCIIFEQCLEGRMSGQIEECEKYHMYKNYQGIQAIHARVYPGEFKAEHEKSYAEVDIV